MDVINDLNEFVDMFRESSRLSENESHLAILRIAQLLEYPDQHEIIFEALMNLPPEIGMKGFYHHLSRLDKVGQDHLIGEFFTIGKKYRSVHNRYPLRLLALCGIMISSGHQPAAHILITIKEIRHFAVENIKRGISIPNSRFMQRFVQKEIITQIGEQLYQIKLTSPLLDNQDVGFITNLFLFSTFTHFEKLVVLPEKQFIILKWAADGFPQLVLQDKLKNLIIKAYERWPDYLKNQLQEESSWELLQSAIELEKPPEKAPEAETSLFTDLFMPNPVPKIPEQIFVPSTSSLMPEIIKKMDQANRLTDEAHQLFTLQIEEIVDQNTALTESIKKYADEITELRNDVNLLKEIIAAMPQPVSKKKKIADDPNVPKP